MTDIFINGTNVNNNVIVGSLNIDDAISERSVASFSLVRNNQAAVGDIVEIYVSDKIIFAGTIDNISISASNANPNINQINVECTDWHQICDRRIIAEAYENKKAGEIATDLLHKYLASEGITGNVDDPIFTRSSSAYKGNGEIVSANIPRLEAGKFGNGLLVEEGTTNRLGSSTDFVTGWNKYSGVTVNVTANQTDPFNNNTAKRITITGGTDNVKYFKFVDTPSISGEKYTLQLWVKLINGSAPLVVHTNISSKTITDVGVWQKVIINTTGDGTTKVGIMFLTQVATDNLDFYACFAQFEDKAYPTTYTDTTRNNESLRIPTNLVNLFSGTVECWVNVNDASKRIISNIYPTIFMADGGGSGKGIWLFHQHNTATWRLQIANDTGSKYFEIPDSLTPNGWHHFAITWDKQYGKLYLNGELKGTISTRYKPTNIIAATIGNWHASHQIDTIIDDVRISNIARSEEEILASYQSNQPLQIDEYTSYKLDFDSDIKNSVIFIQEGHQIDQAVFNYVSATNCLDKLADLMDFSWWIDSYKKLHFADRALYKTNIEITEHSKISNVKIERNRDNYRNRQYIRGGKGTTDPQIEVFKGNGVQKTFTVGFPLAKVPTISVNGVQKTVGIKGVETGKDWYWSKGDPVITQEEEATPIGISDTLQIIYQGLFDIITLSDDYDEVITRQRKEGGTGYYEAVDEEAYIDTSAAAFQSATALLKKYATFGNVLSFTTYMTGLKAGQLININLQSIGCIGEFLIRSVKYNSFYSRDNEYIFSIEAVSCFAADTWTKFFKANLGRPKTYVIRENIQEQEILIRLVQQSESVAWADTLTQNLFICPLPSANLYPSDTLYPC